MLTDIEKRVYELSLTLGPSHVKIAHKLEEPVFYIKRVLKSAMEKMEPGKVIEKKNYRKFEPAPQEKKFDRPPAVYSNRSAMGISY